MNSINNIPRVVDEKAEDDSLEFIRKQSADTDKILEAIKQLISQQASAGAVIRPDEREELNKLLVQNLDRFAINPKKPTTTSVTKHSIDTGDARPINIPPYRIPKVNEEFIESEIKDMEKNGIIEKSNSPWGFPIVLAMKKDGTKRFCIDYRRLNQITRQSSYPIPLISDLLDCFNGAKFFSSIDLASGYWQIPMHPDDIEKTTFNSKYGSYKFNVMPFGLCTAPATFQRLMDEVFEGIKWKNVCVYFDDIFIFSRTFKEHLSHLQDVFNRLRRYELQAKISKCQFVAKQLVFVGHLVSAEGITPDPAKINVVKEWPVPRSTTDVRSFVGLCSYYRKFIDHFATIAAPLHVLQSNQVKFHWEQAHQVAFDKLKQALTTAPLLTMPDFEKPFILQTDASKTGVGAILSQLDANGNEKVIAYASKTLNKAQRNYSVTDQELYAIVFGVRQFKSYLLGRKFTIYTDHESLKWLKSMRLNRDLSGRIARYQMFLQEFEYEPLYRKGESNGNADALSRMYSDDANINVIIGTTEEVNTSLSDVAKHQRNDSELQHVIRYLETDNNTLPEDKSIRDQLLYETKSNKYILLDKVLYHKRVNPLDNDIQYRLVVPKILRHEILFSIHGSTLAAHLGLHKTYEKLLPRYYWKSMYQDTKNLVLSCIKCNARKDPKFKPQFPTNSHVPVGNPMEEISYDALGPFPNTVHGNKHIVVFMCRFTKWCECFAVTNVDERTIAKLITEEIIPRHGCPRTILSDGAQAFNSQLLQEIYTIINAKKITITPYNPQHNGQVERFNHTLVNMLSMFVNRFQTDWDQYINACQFAYRSAINSTTGYSPFYLVYGREPRFPMDIMLQRREYYENNDDYISKLLQRINIAHDIARANLLHRKEKLQSESETLNFRLDYNFGDKVWLMVPDSKIGLSNKFRSRWVEYSILERVSVVNYRICRVLPNGDNEIKLVNVRRLKPATDPSILSQLAHELATNNSDTNDNFEPNAESELVHEPTVEYDVEAIIDRKQIRNKHYYLVKWKGYDNDQNTWEPIEHLVNSPDLISSFESHHITNNNIINNSADTIVSRRKIVTRSRNNKSN